MSAHWRYIATRIPVVFAAVIAISYPIAAMRNPMAESFAALAVGCFIGALLILDIERHL